MKKLIGMVSGFAVCMSMSLLLACGDDSSSSPAPQGGDTPALTDSTATTPDGQSTEPANTDPATDPNASQPTDPATDPNAGQPTDPATDPNAGQQTDPATDPNAAQQIDPVADPAAQNSDTDTSSVTFVSDSKFPFEVLDDEIAKDREYVKASAITAYESIKDVYDALEEGDRVVFVIRHAQRESGTGVESQLTAKGVQQAQQAGTALAGDEPFSYGHTDFVRTRNTAINIAFGRGEDTTAFKSIITPNLVASVYTKDKALFEQYKQDSTELSNEGQVYSKWAFDGSFTDAFYDLEARAVQMISQVIVPDMSTENRVNIFISHDMFLMPLMIYVSDRNVAELQYHVSKKGVSYLSGIAVVVKANGERRYHLVKGV